MRFVYNDLYALRTAAEQLAGQQPIATRRERDPPIPVDVYPGGQRDRGRGSLAWGSVPGYRIQLRRGAAHGSRAGLVARSRLRGPGDHAWELFADPGSPGRVRPQQARATHENGIVRIVLPRQRQRVAHTIKVDLGKADDSSRTVMEEPVVVDSVKGEGYGEVETKTNRRKGRSK